MVRGSLPVVRAIITFTPPVVLSAMTWPYLERLAAELRAPGVPIQYTFTSGQGRCIVRVKDYRINPGFTRLEVDGISVRDELGTEFATVDTLRVGPFEPRYGLDQPVRVELGGVNLRIRRLRSGQYDFSRLISDEAGEPGKTPVALTVRDLRLAYADERVPGPPLLVKVSRTDADVIGDDWVASARLEVEGQRLRAQAEQSGRTGGLWVDVPEFAMRLPARVAAYMRPELPDGLALGTASAKGRLRAYFGREGDPAFVFVGDASAQDLAVNGKALPPATFRGTVTELGAAGTATAEASGAKVRAVAAIRYGKRVSGRASIEASAAGIRAVAPLAKSYGLALNLPSNTDARGIRARADLAIRELDPTRPDVAAVTGRATIAATDLSAEGITARDARLRLHGTGERWTVVAAPINTSVGPASALGEVDLRTQRLRAFAELPRVDSANLPSTLKSPYVSGKVRAVAVASGTFREPAVAIRADADLVAIHPELPGGRLKIPGAAVIGGWSRAGGVAVRRALAPAAGGFFAANGALNPQGTAGLDVIMADVQARQLRPGFGGQLALDARVSGAVTNPVVEATTEGYLLSAETLDIPIARADLRYREGRVVLDSARALRGTANLGASGTFDLKSQRFRLNAQVANVLLDEIATRLEETGQYQRARGSNLVGRVSAENIVVEGTPKAYRARADILAPRLGFLNDQFSYRAENIKTSVDLAGDQLRVTNLVGQLLGGEIRGKASYNLRTQRGDITADASNLQLGLASAEANDIADASGMLNVRGSATLADGALSRAKVRGTVEKVELNRTALGDGQFSADLANQQWQASAGIAQLERFLDVTLDQYHVGNGTLAGSVVASGYPVADVYQLASRYLESSTRVAANNELRQLSARLGLSATIGGTSRKPTLGIENLVAEQLVYRGIALGKASLAAEYTPERTRLGRLDLVGDVATVLVRGDYREDTGFEIDGEVSNLNLAPISAVLPNVGKINGTLNVPFRLSGTMQDPALVASVDARGLFAPDNDPDRGLRIAIDSIDVSPTRGETGGVLIDGKYYYREFQGRGIFKAPFRWSPELGQIGIPSDDPIEAQIQLEPRPLRSVARYVDALLPESILGTVSGGVQLNGTLAQPKLDARLAINDGQLRLRRSLPTPEGERPPAGAQGPTRDGAPLDRAGRYALVGPWFKDVKGSLSLTERDLQFSWESGSVRSLNPKEVAGKVNLRAGIEFGDLPSILNGAIAGDLKPLLDSPVNGQFRLSDVLFSEQLNPGGPGANGRLFADINLSSNLRSPLLKGDLRVNNLVAQVGFVEASNEAAAPPIINPRFDITVSAPGASASAAIASLEFGASGRIQGSLATPVVDFLTAFRSGSLNLPGGRVNLSKESTVSLKYDARSAAAEPQLDVELVGSTSVVTTLYSQIPERYNVNLTVTGNLLNEGGLTYNAESTPAGLTKDQILGLLGGTEIITAFGTTGQRELAEERLRQAVVGLAVPLVFEQITRPLAKSIGLDFIGIDYNAIDGATISSAKSLGRDFNLFVSRQFQQPESGAPLRYELRVDYRPRRLPGYLNRLTFSIGRDEIAPIKLSATYTIRF